MHSMALGTCARLALTFLLALAACGDGEADPPAASGNGASGAGGSTGTNTGGAGGAGGEGGEGGAGGEVTGCPGLAGRYPVPELGPWMYGPHPGPCAQIETNLQTQEEVQRDVYEYDGDRLVGGIRTHAGNGLMETLAFEYEGERMVRMIRDGGTSSSVLTIAYDDDAPSLTYGGDDYFVMYGFDDQGRPTTLTFDYYKDETPPFTTDIVYEGCRLVRREQGVNPLDGTPHVSVPAYEYIFEGDLLVERVGEATRSVFDYSCW
jgi:hypothetical protein